MREEIRKALESSGFVTAKEEKKMSDQPQGLNLSFEQLKELISAAVAESHKMNPIQQKEYDDKINAAKRKALMVVELGKAEEQAMKMKKEGCSHSRHGMGAGKLAGHACAKGKGEWTTGGQLHGDGTATMVCTRCSYTWHWQPTNQEREYVGDAGMLGMSPPEESRLIKEPEPVLLSH